MKVQLKPIHEQVMVITGATSGIGLVTARMAARKGAKLVVTGRNEEALQQLCDEIRGQGGEAIFMVGDVCDEAHVHEVARSAVEYYGQFDTWVNNAGVSAYGTIMQTTLDDARRLFETNFWGVVNGSRKAVEHLRTHGGALINVGSVVSDQAIPLQGFYSASKHAVKGFTDALRIELEKEGAPISVTLIKPSAIDTPYVQHAKNYLMDEPQNLPPVYAPELVAQAIIDCAQHPRRDVTIGGGGKMIALTGSYLPRVVDLLLERIGFSQQHSGRPRRREDRSGLYQGASNLRERGGYPGMVRETSLTTTARLHPVATLGVLTAAGLGIAALMSGVSAPSMPMRRGKLRQPAEASKGPQRRQEPSCPPTGL